MNAAAKAIVRGLSFGFRDRGGPLQQARAEFAVVWCAVAGVAVVLYENPIVLAAMLVATVAVARRCGVTAEVLTAVALAAPIVALTALVNPIASQQGLSVLVAGIELPLVGTFDITSEAVNYGLILGLRAVTVFAVCALYVSTVDPDELLGVLRRHSVRSAITASLAVRFVPVLARDGMRLAEARACRPGPKPAAATVVRSMFARSLDRAGDAALALETRGYALARPMRGERRRWTTADRATMASAVLAMVLVVGGRIRGLAGFEDYPLTKVGAGAADVLFAVSLALAIAVPLFAVRRTSR